MGRKTKKNRATPAVAIPVGNRVAETTAKDRRNAAIVCGLILLAVAAIYGQTLRHEFVNFDDGDYVYQNQDLTRGLSVEGVAWAFSTTRAGNWHPLTWLSLLLDHAWYGPAPWGYHLTNVLLHAANSVLLFLVLWRMTGDLWPSAFTAALFAVHPLRVESVAWVSERKDVLSGLFFMLTLGAYVRYVQGSTAAPDCATAEGGRATAEGGRAPRTGRYLVVVLLFALGLMAKPMLVTLPFVLLLLDYWPLGRMRDSHSLRRLVLEKLPLLALSAVSCVPTLVAQQESAAPIAVLSAASRAANALTAYATYAGRFFYPANLAAYYPYPPNGHPVWEIAGAAALLATICFAVVALRRKAPFLAVGWFWFLGMLVPVIGLVQVGGQATADRYAYLPQIGLALMAAWGVRRIVDRFPRSAPMLGAAVVAALAIFSVAAWRQASYWRDAETLWTRALDCTSDNVLAHVNLGTALCDAGRAAEAAGHFQKAVTLKPDFAPAWNGLGAALCDLNRPAEAVACHEKALSLHSNSAAAHNGLGVALGKQGKWNEAVEQYQRALDADSRHAPARNNLGAALFRLGRTDEAVAQYQEALRLQPRYAEARYNLANALASRNQLQEAVEEYRKALAIKPGYVEARYNLGVVFHRLGRYADSVAQWTELVQLRPDDARFLSQLAWTLATCPEASVRNGPRAVELALRAVKLAGGDPIALDALAAAYAESGRFSEAAATAEQALGEAANRKHHALAEAIRERLRLYQSGAPYRDPRP